MKRIIDGATYNTDTATLVASGRADNDPQVVETVLYQNRAGLYFCVDTITVSFRDRHGEIKERVDHEWNVVGDAAKARAFCEEFALTIDRDIEDMPPEAAPGEKLATVYLRVTPTLKADLDEASSEDKISGNLWATRCLERCLGQRNGYGLTELFQISDIAWSFTNDDAFGASRAKCLEALTEISRLSGTLAERLCGGEKQMVDAEIWYRSSLEAQEIGKRFSSEALEASASEVA